VRINGSRACLCRERVRDRNRTKPEGIYWGDVSDALLDEVNKYFQPPTHDEGFTIVEHVAAQMSGGSR